MRLAVDANVLLSALIGGKEARVLSHPAITEVLTTEPTLAEVQEYAGLLAKKRRLPEDLVLLAAASLPISVVPRERYSASLPEARKRIAERDPDDVELLALAIRMKLPVWSNDNDFEDAGVTWYTTAELLRLLAGQ
ncbi:MAG: PIN domain-containing protein [Acidobacteria bacterium]|nr:PIN domain-containing protein [Acidobacteriota bacterium]